MNINEKLLRIKNYTDKIGQIYGTEDFSIYLYSLIKMSKPKKIVELGTGLGSVMLWSALALEENRDEGLIYTVDNGSDWDHLKQAKGSMGDMFREQYSEYVNNLIDNFKLSSYINFINSDIAIHDLPNDIDILFSDFSHGPVQVLSIINQVLPKLSDTSILMFDSASTYYPSYLVLREIVEILNKGQIPASFNKYDELSKKVNRCTFELRHVIENKSRDQNSTACIHIQPRDIFPSSLTHMRF